MSFEPWQVWGREPDVEVTLPRRATGELGEMESTKQLVKLIGDVYEPGMRILDVGCNVGHYLRGIRRIGADVTYRGVDAYEHVINKARQIFKDDRHASFDVKDIHQPLYPDHQYDIVYCCNVILHLPFFKKPVKNLLDSTSEVCFIRTLLSEHPTTISRHCRDNLFDDDGNPIEWAYQNTYNVEFFADHVHGLGYDIEYIADEFDPSVLQDEHKRLKRNHGTRIVGTGVQADGNVLFHWKWAKITRR